ncbi:hypothetical protein [Rhizorhabdus histidinilytica]
MADQIDDESSADVATIEEVKLIEAASKRCSFRIVIDTIAAACG